MLKVRSSWIKLGAAVLVLAILSPAAASYSAAQETRKKSFDFSARNTGDVLKLDPKIWTDINRFVFLIAFDVYRRDETKLELASRFSRLDSYPQLLQACRRWGNVTFQGLQKLAEELSTGDIRRLLVNLKSAVELRPKDPAGAQKAFVAAADQLVLKLSERETLSKNVKQDLDSLSTQTLAAAIQLRAAKSPEERRIVDIGPELGRVVSALAGVSDRWGALSSDLSALRKEMETSLNSRDPFLLDISLEIGLTSWESVETAAKSFITSVPKERKYLTGDNYYDECPLQENVWYLLQTKGQVGYQEPTAIGTAVKKADLDAGSRPPPNGGEVICLFGQPVGLGEPDPKMQWRFQRLGRGWWRIINRAEGDTKNLDLWLDIPYVNRGTPAQNWRQWWRFVPTSEAGYFRIYGASLGETLSLTAPSKKANPLGLTRMRESRNAPEQYWRFRALPTKAP